MPSAKSSVKFERESGAWRDVAGRDWRNAVPFSLPEHWGLLIDPATWTARPLRLPDEEPLRNILWSASDATLVDNFERQRPEGLAGQLPEHLQHGTGGVQHAQGLAFVGRVVAHAAQFGRDEPGGEGC